MYVRRLALAMTVLALPATATVALMAPNDVEEMAFPVDFTAGVHYASVDRPELKLRLELYAAPDAIAAARKGEPFPEGTTLTAVRYKARLDAEGRPMRDAEGRMIKDGLAGYSVMEKHRGRGNAYPPDLRNGEWGYRVFTPDKAVDERIDLAVCLRCHKQQEAQDFVFSRAKMQAMAR